MDRKRDLIRLAGRHLPVGRTESRNDDFLLHLTRKQIMQMVLDLPGVSKCREILEQDIWASLMDRTKALPLVQEWRCPSCEDLPRQVRLFQSLSTQNVYSRYPFMSAPGPGELFENPALCALS